MKEEIKTGYKATDKNMQCRGYQFELGVWHKHDGELAMCESGFHFCEYPSGPWAYYSAEGTRIFKVEAKNILPGEVQGADLKHVAMEIRLVEEIIPAGDGNTGDRNTGNGNTGNRNTGNGNTGEGNTGDGNTGYRNTGDGNTGDGNTGNGNTGNRNTGNGNTGDGNTGNGNTGYRNTGNWNTGNGNTGYGNTGEGNATDRCSGYLCCKKQPVIIFDKKVKEGVIIPYYLISKLSELLTKDDNFDIEQFLEIPNATKKGILDLHASHIQRRKDKK